MVDSKAGPQESVVKGNGGDPVARPKVKAPRRRKLAPLPPGVLTVADAKRVAEEPLDEVIPSGVLVAGEKVVIAGPPKQLKTWLALHWSRCIACGEPVFGEPSWTPEPQPVLFVQEEGQTQRWARRIAATFEDVDVAPFYYRHRKRFQLEDRADLEWLMDAAASLRARVIFIDPWQRVTAGMNENDTGETGPAWDAVHEIATETNAVVVILHHTRKDAGLSIDAIRGSSRMAGEADMLVVMRKTADGNLEINLDGREYERSKAGNLIVSYDEPPSRTMRHDGYAQTESRTSAQDAALGVLLAAGRGRYVPTARVVELVTAALGRDITKKSVLVALHKLAALERVDGRPVKRGQALEWTAR